MLNLFLLLQTHEIDFAGREVIKDDVYQKWWKSNVIKSKNHQKTTSHHQFWSKCIYFGYTWLKYLCMDFDQIWLTFLVYVQVKVHQTLAI